MQQGFIIVHRKITKNWLWLSEPFTKSQAWIDLLLIANHTPNSFFIRGIKIDVKRGQIGWSEENIALRWKWSRNKLRKFLKVLEKEQQIKQHKSNIINIIEILNYDIYQDMNTKMNTKMNNKKTTEKQQKDTNNKCITNEEQCLINEKELESKYLFSKLPIFINKNLWKVFIDFRISIATKHKPFTEHAKELLIKDLTKFEASRTGNANIALENSIKNSWQGVFEPKNNYNNNYSQPLQPNSISSSFDEKKNFYLENRNRIHPNLNEINDILNKIDNNQSKTQIIAYKAKTAFFVSNNANANLELDDKLEKYFDLIVVVDYKTKEKYEL